MPAKRKGWLTVLLRYGIPLMVSVGLCWLLFARVDVAENVEIISRYCHIEWILLTLALSVVSHLIRAARWGIQLQALDIRTPYLNLVYSIFGTYAVNLVLPRLGELWRTGYIARRQDASLGRVFGSMVADRMADAVTVLIITLFTAVLAWPTLIDYIDSEPGRLDSLKALAGNSWVWTTAGVVIIGAWLLLTRLPKNLVSARIKGVWQSLWAGFVVVLRMPGRGLWLLYTVLLWGCYFLQLYVAFYAFDFTAQIASGSDGTTAVLVCFVLSTIAMILPSNGGIGPWQMAVVYGLSFYSAGVVLPPGRTFEAMSIAFANCVMTSQTILLIILGLITFIGIALDRRLK